MLAVVNPLDMNLLDLESGASLLSSCPHLPYVPLFNSYPYPGRFWLPLSWRINYCDIISSVSYYSLRPYPPPSPHLPACYYYYYYPYEQIIIIIIPIQVLTRSLYKIYWLLFPPITNLFSTLGIGLALFSLVSPCLFYPSYLVSLYLPCLVTVASLA